MVILQWKGMGFACHLHGLCRVGSWPLDMHNVEQVITFLVLLTQNEETKIYS